MRRGKRHAKHEDPNGEKRRASSRKRKRERDATKVPNVGYYATKADIQLLLETTQ